jgi:hypothetical protein
MNFVNNNDFVSALSREETDIFLQFPDFLDAAIRSAVNFMNINCVASFDLNTMLAFVAGDFGRALLTIKGLGNQPGKGRFPNTTNTAENNGMGYTIPANGILKRSDNRLLSYYFLKCLGAPFSG